MPLRGVPRAGWGVHGAREWAEEEGFLEGAGQGPGAGKRRVCVRGTPRAQPEDHAGRMEDTLDELLQHREPGALQRCLRKVRALGQGAWEGGAFSPALLLT